MNIPASRNFLACILLLLLTGLLLHPASAQKVTRRFATDNDIVKDSLAKRKNSPLCNNPLSYLPDTLHPELSPMRHVRINVHIIQDGHGNYNFSEAEGRKWIKSLVENANTRLKMNGKMNLPTGNSTPVLPIPFRYQLTGDPNNPKDDGIYFHRNDSLFCMNKKSKNKNNVFDTRQYETYGIRKDTVINIFFIEHCPDSIKSPTYKASNDGVGTGTWVKMVGSYYNWSHPVVMSNGDTMRYSTWQAAGLFNHELGHTLGLSHSWNSDDGCEDTPLNRGCWNFNDPAGCTEVSNNVMDYNYSQMAYSPCQIGKICRNFHNPKQTRKFLVPEWCTYDETKTITIKSGESAEWDRAVDVFGDLVVENNATLTITCNVSIPPGGKIILMPKATLILDGCTITSLCEGSFEGIEIWEKKNTKPQIFLKNRARVEKIVHPI